MTHRSTLAAVVTTAFAVFAAAPLFVPSPDDALKTINLGKSILVLAPTSQLGLPITLVGWEEAINGMTITIIPEPDVAVEAGDLLGQNSQLLPPLVYSVIEITKVSDTALQAKLTIPGVVADHLLPVSTLGVFDATGEARPPTLIPFGHVPGDPTRLRTRMWVDYYGLRTAVTFIDG